jgi:D-alanyl-D-alanine carboxypeptidase (penicillin-binding protein 5/6)
MKNIVKKTISILLLAGLIVQPANFATEIIHPTTLPNIQAYALYDRETDFFISDYHLTQQMGLASISKLMTTKILLDHIKSGNLSLDDKVYISKNAQSQDGDGLRLREGDYVKLDDLLHGLLICSSNDAAVALAEHCAGSEDAFVALMNAEARALDLPSAHFENPSGLTEYGPNHETLPIQNVMSIADINKLADILISQYPEITEITTLTSWTFEQKGVVKNSTNKLLPLYSEVNGLKTGFTNYAGYCQIVSATLNDLTIDDRFFINTYGEAPISEISKTRDIFASVLGSVNKTNRNNTLKFLLDYSKTTMSLFPITDTQVPLFKNEEQLFNIVPEKSVALFLPNDIDLSFQVFINPIWQNTNMIVDGLSVGKIICYSEDTTFYTVPLVLSVSLSNYEDELERDTYFTTADN